MDGPRPTWHPGIGGTMCHVITLGHLASFHCAAQAGFAWFGLGQGNAEVTEPDWAGLKVLYTQEAKQKAMNLSGLAPGSSKSLAVSQFIQRNEPRLVLQKGKSETRTFLVYWTLLERMRLRRFCIRRREEEGTQHPLDPSDSA